MKEFFKHLKWMSLLDAVASIALGFFMIFCTDATVKTLIFIFAGLLLVVGVVKIVNYFMYGIEPFGFVSGVVSTVLGLVFMLNVNAISASNILGVILGLILLVKSLLSVQESFDLRRFGARWWWIDTVLSLLMLAFAIVVICNPAADKIMFTWLGITVIVGGVLDLIDIFVVSAKVKKTKKSLKDMFTIENDDNIIDI